jgi:hypothetical protein
MQRTTLLLFLLCLAGSALAATAPPRITFAAREVTCSGFLPNAKVVVLGVSNEAGQYIATMQRRDAVVDADLSGVARYALDAGVPPRSVWFAVDAATGAYAVGSPDGFPLRPSLPAPTLVLGKGSSPESLRIEAEIIELLVVVPGVGVWRDTAAHRGGKDLDKDSRAPARLSAAAFTPTLGTTAKLDHIPIAGAVVIVVNPDTLRYFAGASIEVAP